MIKIREIKNKLSCKIDPKQEFYSESWALIIRFLICAFMLNILIAVKGFAYQNIEVGNDYIINKYDREGFLPTNTVTDILITSKGFLFAASNNGLIISDGWNWDVINVSNTDELRTNRILKVFETDTGEILIIDQLSYLYVLEEGRELRLLSIGEDGDAESIDVVAWNGNDIVYIDDNHLHFENQTAQLFIDETTSIGKVWDIQFFDNKLYIVSTKGVFQLVDSSGQLLPVSVKNVETDFYSRFSVVDDNLIVFGKGGIDCVSDVPNPECFNKSIGFSRSIQVRNVRKLDDSDDILIATNQGLFIEKEGRIVKQDYSGIALQYESYFKIDQIEFLITTKGVWASGDLIYQPEVEIVDASSDGKSLWITTAQEGIILIKKNPFQHLSGVPLLNSYSVVSDESGRLINGSFDHGISLIEENSIEHIQSDNSELPNNTIRMIAPLKNGDFVISTWGEPPLLLANNRIQELPVFENLDWTITNVAEAFHEFENGDWLIGSLDGLYYVSSDNIQEINFDDSSPIRGVSRIVKNEWTGELFLSTQFHGVIIYKDGILNSISSDLPENALQVRDVFIQSRDTIWVASYNTGLQWNVLDATTRQPLKRKTLGSSYGIPETGLHNVVLDEQGLIWISSNDGLLQVPYSELLYSIEHDTRIANLKIFEEQDGLINQEFNGGSQNTSLKNGDNLWFTNQSGIVGFNSTVLNPEPFNANNFYLRSLTTAETEIEFPLFDTLFVSYRERYIDIDFAHINLTSNLTDDFFVSQNEGPWEKTHAIGSYQSEKLGKVDVFQFALSPISDEQYTFVVIRQVPFYATVWFHVVLFFFVIGTGFVLVKRVYEGQKSNDGTELTESRELTVVDRIKATIETNFADAGFNLDRLSADLKMSRSKVYREWSSEMNTSLNEYILTVRIDAATKMLNEGQLTITEIAELSGFKTQSYFSKVFKKQTGISPTGYMKKKNDELG